MREKLNSMIAAAAVASVLLLAALPVVAQTANSRGPRTADGKPNLNGIWQVLTEANWDLQGHAAAAGPMIPLGAIGAMPPGQGVVEGEEIPYKPEALATKKAEFRQPPEARSGSEMLSAGRAARHLHAVPVSDRADPQDYILITYEYANAARTIYMKDPGPAPVR